jgi:CrcB protein
VTILWVALGGAAGSATRYLVSAAINDRWDPWGTVAVNVVGSLALGFLLGRWGLEVSAPARLGLTVGVLGGFTTFSTFTMDVVGLWESGQTTTSVAVAAISVLLGIVAAVAGLALGRT